MINQNKDQEKLCDFALKENAKIDQILEQNPQAEPFKDYYDPCEGCLSKKGGYNDCPGGM